MHTLNSCLYKPDQVVYGLRGVRIKSLQQIFNMSIAVFLVILPFGEIQD